MFTKFKCFIKVSWRGGVHIELGITSFVFKQQAKKKFFTKANQSLQVPKNLCFELGLGAYFQIVIFINIDGLILQHEMGPFLYSFLYLDIRFKR